MLDGKIGHELYSLGHVPNILSNLSLSLKISSELIDLMRPHRYYRLIIFL
jgi:hypothetical protein